MPPNLIPSAELGEQQIPSDDCDMESIETFALTFDGYNFWGSFEACADNAKSSCNCLDHLRTKLFFAQRAGRQSEGLERSDAVPLLSLIRLAISSSYPVTCIVGSAIEPHTSFGIVDLLKHFGFDASEPTKLVRHQDKRFNIQDLIASGWFDLYQACQKNDVFGKCKQIVTFTADGATRSRFLGVYRVLNTRKRVANDIPANCPYHQWRDEPGVIYKLQHQSQFASLEGRVVIDWGSGALAWHQHLRNREIIEIFPSGRLLSPFSDYLDFSLSFNELKQLHSNPAAHRDWRTSLSAVAGIYLILDEVTGHQYVGSAYGVNGFWGRWADYADTGHGNNKCLADLMSKSDDYPKRFRFSILQVLPKSTKPKEVMRWETEYKVKLGTRVTGLNLN